MFIRKFYNALLNQLTYGALKESRISFIISRFLQFIRWCDSNKIHSCLDSDMDCIEAFDKYSNYCWEQVSCGKIKSNAVTMKLACIINLLKEITPEKLHANLPIIKNLKNDREPTVPPDDIHASENIQILHAIINGAYDFLLSQKKYPYAWTVPSFLNIKNNTLWIFPINNWCQINFNKHGIVNEHKIINLGFNYKYGRIATKRELKLSGILNDYTQMQLIRKANSTLEAFNAPDNTLRSYHKNDFITGAIASFTFLLIANSGMNPTQALSLKWNDEYEIFKDNIDFHSIKYRAFGKKVHFRVTSKFIPTFKNYLKLREFYLLGKSSDYLIPSFGKKYDNHLDLVDISKKIKGIMNDLDYPKGLIVARKWRCLKAEWLIKNADPSVAAKLLQNTETSILNHYSLGTFSKQTEEISNFLTKLPSINILTDGPYKISTSVGGCKAPNKPINISVETSFKSDCKQPEGCLFCDKFLIHADESDLRKILSCKFCIENTQSLSRTYDEWHKIYDPVILRIDEIVSVIAEIDISLVDRIKNEVYIEGNLDSYWSSKLEMLITIGAIQNES